MKTIPIALAEHMDGGSTSLADLLKVTRTDGQVFAFTSWSSDLSVDGVDYLAGPGLDVSGIVIAAGLAVDNLELTTLDDGTTFTSDDVLAGRWRNAEIVISRCNARSVLDGVEIRVSGTIGKVYLREGYVVAELRGLQQILQQPIGSVSSPTCRARLGDERCTESLVPWTHTGTVTSVTSNRAFTASGLTQADDYFGNGILTWTSGPNIGLSFQVKTHAVGGVITLMLLLLFDVDVGHTFSIVAGCRNRLEDCRDKFDNVHNMQAEPHLPGVDNLTSPA